MNEHFLEALKSLQEYIGPYHDNGTYVVVWEDIGDDECAYVRQVADSYPNVTIVINATSTTHFKISLHVN